MLHRMDKNGYLPLRTPPIMATTRSGKVLTRQRIQKAVAVTFSLLCLTAVMPFVYHERISGHEVDRTKELQIERRIGRAVRSLNNIQKEREIKDLQKTERRIGVVMEKFPWVVHNNTVPNYFLQQGQLSGDTYQQGPHIFMHHHRSGGTTLTECLNQLASNHSYAMAPVMGSQDRVDWDSGRGLDKELRPRLKLHRGQYSFGMCKEYDRACSYFTMLRHPLERAVSSYEYCKTAFGDEMCKVMNANDVTLKQWIVHQGSVLFQQLAFQTEWCSDPPNTNFTADAEFLIEHDKMPCWYKNKLKLDAQHPSNLLHLQNYIISNLQNWFSVIGIFEEFTDSLNMIESVTKLPLSECKNVLLNLQNDFDVTNNRANRKKKRGGGYYDDNDIDFLRNDYEVKIALDADVKIYKKAKDLFNIQRQIFTNQLDSNR